MDEKIRYTSSVRLLLEEYMKNYTPQIIKKLSKDMFDLYLVKKGAIDNLLTVLEDPNLDTDGFKNRVKGMLSITIENAKLSPEMLEKSTLEAKIELYEKILKI